MKNHTHRAKTRKDVGFVGYSVNPGNPEPAAHGWMTEIATCSCGAIRLTNHNQDFFERGEWEEPGLKGPRTRHQITVWEDATDPGAWIVSIDEIDLADMGSLSTHTLAVLDSAEAAIAFARDMTVYQSWPIYRMGRDASDLKRIRA